MAVFRRLCTRGENRKKNTGKADKKILDSFKKTTKSPAVAGIADRTGFSDFENDSSWTIFMSFENQYVTSY